MTANLTGNKPVRAEQYAFLEGVMWVAGHMREGARRVRDDVRGVVEVEGKPPVEAIIKSGNPEFAKQLVELADTIEQEGLNEAVMRYPSFDPLPPAAKSGETSGF